MAKCIKWGQQVISTCTKWADQGSYECSQWADQGANECKQWADQGSSQCSSWWKWFCKAFYWVAKWVCVAYYWVAKWVCIAVLWVAKWVCIITTVTTVAVCLIFEWIVFPIVKALLFLILAPFAAAIDSVCQTCNAYDWVKDHFWTPGKIEFITRRDDPGNPGQSQYDFVCHCFGKKDKEVTIVAANDDEAAQKAKEACGNACR